VQWLSTLPAQGFYGVVESCLKGPSYGAFAAGQEEELHAVQLQHIMMFGVHFSNFMSND